MAYATWSPGFPRMGTACTTRSVAFNPNFTLAPLNMSSSIAGLATLQGLNVIAVERKTRQVGKLRRIAEHTERQIVGKLAKAVEIAGKLKIALRSSMDVDRAEQEDLGRRAGPQGFGDRLSASNGGDLILTHPEVLLKGSPQGTS